MQQIIIGENEAGQRFEKYLHKFFPSAAASFLFKMLRKKNIVLNGRKADGKEMLQTGDCVKLFLADETIIKFGGRLYTDQNLPAITEYEQAYHMLSGIEVILENQHVVVLNKPVGILTQKAQKQDLSLNEWLIGYLLVQKAVTRETLHTYKPSVCNRLDRNTSGMVLCAKSLTGSQRLSLMLKERTLHKFYHLLVLGRVQEKAEIRGFLEKDKKNNLVKITQNPNDQPIITQYTPLEVKQDITFLEVELITGKTHQIRAHLASIGHPLIGDYKYGSSKANPYYKERYHVESQLLHACRLEFPACEPPLTDMSGLTLTAKEPAVFAQILKHEK